MLVEFARVLCNMAYIKYEHRPLQQVVDDLYAARGELFDDLFAHAWALLDEAARRVLLVMTFFPVTASGKALAATADVQGFAFDHASDRLTDLALLDVQQIDLNSPLRYTLHPLVRAFVAAKRQTQPGFEVEARDRWVQWYIELVQKVGWCWGQLRKLDVLDPEQGTIFSVLSWTEQNNHHAEILEIVKGSGYYYYIRGPGDKIRLNRSDWR